MIETRDLRNLGLMVLLAAAVFAMAGSVLDWMNARTAAPGPEQPPAGPPAWMLDDLLAEARQITREAASDGPCPG